MKHHKSVRIKASQMKNLELKVARDPKKNKHFVSTLENDTLNNHLQDLRARYYFEGLPPKEGTLEMNHLMQELKYPVKLDNFKRLQPEEIEKYREFSKNYVFAGDQFLYVNIKNPKFKYEEFARRMKVSEMKLREIKRKAKRISRQAIAARIQTKVNKATWAEHINGLKDPELAKIRLKIEETKDRMEEFIYKRDKIKAENDHILKANKLLIENSKKIDEKILQLEVHLKEGTEHTIDMSKDRTNVFSVSDEQLLWRKMQNYENLLDLASLLGKYVDKFSANNLKFVAKPFPLAYIYEEVRGHVSKYQSGGKALAGSQFKAYQPLLEEEKKKKELIDELFEDMRLEGEVPRYLAKGTLTRIEKLKEIRNYYEGLLNQR